MGHCMGGCYQGREVCKTPERCGLITSDGGESVDFTAEGFFHWLDLWIAIGAVLTVIGLAGIAFAGYSLWPSLVAAWSGL